MKGSFTPIAIVGRACTLPGVSTPEQLWQVVSSSSDQVSEAPADRWGVDDVMCDPADPQPDRTWSDRGGYVTDFTFDPDGYAVAAADLIELDPIFQWTLQTARTALAEVSSSGATVGAVLGNLSFPSAAMARYAHSVWTGTEGPDARNRFSSGLPALVLEEALGLEAGAFALDAACASSLYAIKYACDRLADGDADVMLAGAVNATDDLFIHVGFSALAALSKTGQSRPFHAEADGLVPAEGAAFVALKRLEDAQADGDEIYGVIRGVGLSNDGRGRGFLVPSSEGQVRAMRSAYDVADVDPHLVSLVECHATGTTVGDAAELTSIGEVFAPGVPIGSLKSNLGHLITVAGVAGLIKVTEALAHRSRPPSLHTDQLSEAATDGSSRVLQASEPWDSDRPLMAGVSAFGFGGNNGHLVIEEYVATETYPQGAPAPETDIAIVGVGVIASGCPDRASFADALFSETSQVVDGQAPIDSFDVDIAKLGMPPKDLEHTLPQQLVMLSAGAQAAAEVGPLPRNETGVFVGMGVDAEVARYGARWRSSGREGDRFVEALDSVSTIGTMPNIVANRLNRLLDLAGPSCSVSAEEQSGLEALALAVRALATRELDAALVGAVDLSCEPVHAEAAKSVLGPDRQIPGDAAVALVLKRLDDAVADGDHIYATLPSDAADEPVITWGPGEGEGDLVPRFGHAHAASGLMHLAAAALSIDAKRRPGGAPWLGERTARAGAWTVGEHGSPKMEESVALFHVYDGPNRDAVAEALRAGRQSSTWRTEPQSGARLVIVAENQEQLAARTLRAIKHFEGAPAGEGVVYRDRPIEGDLGFVYASAGSAYEGMGLELLAELPDLGDAVHARHGDLSEALEWAVSDTQPTNGQRLWGASAISRIHTELTTELLGLRPDSAIGYSSGESTSLFSLGVWNDLLDMRTDIVASGMYEKALDGPMETVASVWDEDGPIDWAVWNVIAPVDTIRAAIENEPRVHLAIIHTVDNCVIAGDAAAVARVIEQLGSHQSYELAYNMAAHVPEVEGFRQEWLDIHRREVTAVPDVRFYSAGLGRSYEPTPEACAEAILAQAVATLDFPTVVNQAYEDGVRVFLEHGPQGLCSGWIREILGDRPAEVISLDRKARGVSHVLDAVATLIASGVTVDPARLEAALAPRRSASEPTATTVTLDAHPNPIAIEPARELVPVEAAVSGEVMAPAPALPSVLFAPTPSAAPVAAVPVPDVVVAQPASVPAVAESLPFEPADDSRAAHLSKIVEVHNQFLATQAAVHAQFLSGTPSLAPKVTEEASPPVQASAPAPVVAAPVQAAPPRVVPPSVVPPIPALAEPPVTRPKVPKQPTEPIDAPKAVVPEVVQKRTFNPTGLSLDSEQVAVHASGKISEIFGPVFEDQDDYFRQVRMPQAPLLLVDRMTGIDAEPGVHGKGIIWTESDVTADKWFMNRGRMPAGILIESGQADLMLISYMGADLLNQSERVYRLLGCELTYMDDLPAPGDTLSYEIHVDGHANQDDIRLFFFHYDCVVDGVDRIQVRHGQAGFFTDAELADSGGVLWSAEEAEPCDNPRLDPPVAVSSETSFDADAVRAFAEGRIWDCFGDEFAHAKTHTRSPAIQTGQMLLLDSVQELSLDGGPWGRGYLRGETPVTPDDWFFSGHFLNDPCMPGTLMFEGCLQALSFTLAGMGHTLERDGWRFQPVKNEPINMVCRGQVTPSSGSVVYEVFVEEVIAGPIPTVYADLLCTVDGQKAFHAKRVGLQLVPDWPLENMPAVIDDVKPVASVMTETGPFELGFPALLACAWGKPSDAFGPMYERFDGHGRVPRLPGPPYHFVTRVTEVTGQMGGMEVGSTVAIEYDIPDDVWYLNENGARTMPFAVLLEAALQPCGWLASYIGSALTVESELAFRNLDGTGTLHEELTEGTLTTKVELTGVSQSAGMIIVNFAVQCYLDERLVYDLTTVFGFFPPESLVVQVGLPVSDELRAELEAPSEFLVDLVPLPERYYSGSLALGRDKLHMLHRITDFQATGGAHGLGRLRAERDIEVDDWYFKAHFFQDPVQPGSLGIEAMIQLLQFYMIETGLGDGIPDARFEPLATNAEMTWKYRGQVIPTNDLVQVTMDVTEVRHEDGAVLAVASTSLWCDGIRIYHADDLGMRIVSGGATANPLGRASEVSLDPEVDTWLVDHRPTWNRPALPMMSIVDMLVAPVGETVVGVSDVAVASWIDFEGPRSFYVELDSATDGYVSRLISDGEEVASAKVRTGTYPERPEPWSPVEGASDYGSLCRIVSWTIVPDADRWCAVRLGSLDDD